MAVDFSNTLIVAVSTTTLFDLSESEAQLMSLMKQDPKTAISKYRHYMKARENEPLQAGSSYPLIKALLNLNKYDEDKAYDSESPLVEVVIVSKNDPDTGVRVLHALREHGLNITRSAFVSGELVADYVANFKVDLFLTNNHEDAQAVTDAGICACALLDANPVQTKNLDSEQLRIAFDGDAVLFDDSGELLYQRDGLQAFHDREEKLTNLPIEKGPYADFLIKLSNLQKRLPNTINTAEHPIQIALVTARNAPADLRAIKTLRLWGVQVDMAFFLGGLDKTHVLETFAPHIFFDDSIKHIDRAKDSVPSALVPYHLESELKAVKEEKAKAEQTSTNHKTEQNDK